MPHYWFSHRANSQLNVPNQWSKADIIQPWLPFPAWRIEINVLLNKAAYSWAFPTADGLIVYFYFYFIVVLLISQVLHTVVHVMMELLRALHEVWCPCCDVRCCLSENSTIGPQSQKQPCEKERMSVDEIRGKTAALVRKGLKDLKCPWKLEACVFILHSQLWDKDMNTEQWVYLHCSKLGTNLTSMSLPESVPKFHCQK